jgi:hypothetical protein
MDKIIKITLGAFIILLIGFLSLAAMNFYAENAYVTSLTGNYTYATTITTDSTLSNVTLFIPVPEDLSGNSPVVAAISGGTLSGVPASWKLTLFYTGKTTVVKIAVPSINPPEGTTSEKPFSITFSANISSKNISSKNHIETINPIEKGVIFRPVQNLSEVPCGSGVSGLPPSAGSQHCFEYQTSIYADYQSSPDASVSISSDMSGQNSWRIFELHSNEYRARITAAIPGESHGWMMARGMLITGTGIHDEPMVTV